MPVRSSGGSLHSITPAAGKRFTGPTCKDTYSSTAGIVACRARRQACGAEAGGGGIGTGPTCGTGSVGDEAGIGAGCTPLDGCAGGVGIGCDGGLDGLAAAA